MSRAKKPNDDVFVAEIVDATRAVKARLVQHRAALRRGERLKVATVEETFLDTVSQTVVALDSCLTARGDAFEAGADRGEIVRAAIEYACKPLRDLLEAWGGA